MDSLHIAEDLEQLEQTKDEPERYPLMPRAVHQAEIAWTQYVMPMIQASLIVFACVAPFFSLLYVELTIHLGVIIVATACLIRDSIAASTSLMAERVSKAMAPAVDRGPTA